MSGHPRSGWWKLASSPQGGEDAIFKKLMYQALERKDKAKHMEDLVLGGGAPPWLTGRLTKWMLDTRNEPFPEWIVRLAGILLSQEGHNPLLDQFREHMFDPVRFWSPSWAHLWGISLASRPDDIPAWLERELEININTHGYVPHWAHTWAESKLRSGKMDGMRKKLEELVLSQYDRDGKTWCNWRLIRLLKERRRDEYHSESHSPSRSSDENRGGGDGGGGGHSGIQEEEIPFRD